MNKNRAVKNYILSCMLICQVIQGAAVSLVSEAHLCDSAGRGFTDVIIKCIASGIDIDCVDSKGDTPLMIAARCNQLEAVQELLDAGAKIDRQNNDRETAFLQACIYDFSEQDPTPLHKKIDIKNRIIRLLYQQGASINTFDVRGLRASNYITETLSNQIDRFYVLQNSLKAWFISLPEFKESTAQEREILALYLRELQEKKRLRQIEEQKKDFENARAHAALQKVALMVFGEEIEVAEKSSQPGAQKPGRQDHRRADTMAQRLIQEEEDKKKASARRQEKERLRAAVDKLAQKTNIQHALRTEQERQLTEKKEQKHKELLESYQEAARKDAQEYAKIKAQVARDLKQKQEQAAHKDVEEKAKTATQEALHVAENNNKQEKADTTPTDTVAKKPNQQSKAYKRAKKYADQMAVMAAERARRQLLWRYFNAVGTDHFGPLVTIFPRSPLRRQQLHYTDDLERDLFRWSVQECTELEVPGDRDGATTARRLSVRFFGAIGDGRNKGV